MSMMRKICAWCGADLGTVEGSTVLGGFTHGVCRPCCDILVRRTLEEFSAESEREDPAVPSLR